MAFLAEIDLRDLGSVKSSWRYLRDRDRQCDFDRETELLAAWKIKEMLISSKQCVSASFIWRNSCGMNNCWVEKGGNPQSLKKNSGSIRKPSQSEFKGILSYTYLGMITESIT